MTKTKATKTAHAARMPIVINDILRQCELPDGPFDQGILRTTSKILKCSQKQAKRKLGVLESRGAPRAGLHRGTSGTFITAPCPQPSIGLIMDQPSLTALKEALLADFETVYLRSALSNNTGPKSKFLEPRSGLITASYSTLRNTTPDSPPTFPLAELYCLELSQATSTSFRIPLTP